MAGCPLPQPRPSLFPSIPPWQAQVHRHHPPLIYGRSMADCEPEMSTGIAVIKVERSSGSNGSGGGGSAAYIAATYEQPHTSAQAVPRLQDFAQRFLAADG